MIVNEGLRKNDLVNMMSSMVSIDEYKSKIDDSAIVIAFYASSKDVAVDVNRFIQKSYVDLLDTEISAAPDQEGYYLIFVEMLLNDTTAKGISDICRELESLTGYDRWEIRVRGAGESEVVLSDAMAVMINTKLKQVVDDALSDSKVISTKMKENAFEAFNGVTSMSFLIQDSGSYDDVYSRNSLHESHINMSMAAIRTSREMKTFLGENWSVDCMGSMYVAHNRNTDSLLLLTI